MELLRLFGIPFVISPMEAEAQCATLDELELTNGTITDDSDIWLFGGRCVYKNFFNQNKHVEVYRMLDIFNRFGLDRKKLIALALLVGSDYTHGIDGIGVIAATEILGEFPGDDIEGLQKFRTWWVEAQKQRVPPTETKIKQRLRKITVSDGFPSSTVFEAYLNPITNDSKEKFSWAMPDLDALREFANSKFGWTQNKTDDLILPVLKKLNETQSQMRIENYFNVKLEKEQSRTPSKRLRRAIKKIVPSEAMNEIKNPTSLKSKGRKQSKGKLLYADANLSESSTSEEDVHAHSAYDKPQYCSQAATSKGKSTRLHQLNAPSRRKRK